ncbi:MAG: putative DNA binding domain-containing protein [Bacteroidetes bacterium]|nr:putative DNA binding domain-containing protein [Bacteroidota bacterium]MBX7239806.1 putative DNA binding domain-containing protein [Bacteroidia bacterium]MCC7514672.1 putative DNA binding domain-containing protein [Bacteroidia bacterium]MCW5919030.1 putative DNA binding domain-containing protein [Bacteroidota bacterium]HCI58477.1 transcriptional regulator [Bacteroidota bacterium]
MSETQNIEYKSSWRDEYLKWICGFANANGGVIFIGKDDAGKVVGISDAKKLMEEIPNKVKDTLGILVDVNLHKSKQGGFVEIVVEPYPYPVNYKGQYHIRSGSTKQELKGAALNKFLLQKKGKRWDGVPVPKVSVKDLKQETFEFFRKRALKSQRIDEDSLTDSNEHLIENLQLKESEYLNRAAILLFHSSPEKFVTGAYIKIGYFQSDDDLKFQDEIHGNLFEQIEKAMDLLFTKYIKAEISYEGINRVEKFEYPKEAVREALMNAIAHKDYSGGVPIQISVYSDKVIFWNEGQLPDNWTVKTLLEKHASRPYNPDIANALFRSGYIESWGRGTIKIIKECKQAGIPEPVFSYDSSDISVEFRKDIYNEKYLQSLDLNERQVKALLFTKDKGKITNRQYQTLNNCSRNTASNDLSELVDKEFLKPSGQKGAGAFYTLK